MVRIHPPQPKIKMNSKNNLVIFSGNSNPGLAKKIVKKLNKPLGKATVGRFSDQEMNIKIEENVRGKDVFIVQSTCCLLYTSPSPRDGLLSRMPSSA